MSIQILGLRPYTSQKTGKTELTERFYEKGWKAESVPILFEKIEAFINQIPVEERYNLYYTAASCHQEPGRRLKSQQAIPFDIDGIDLERINDYIPIVLDVLKVEHGKTGIVASGNGLQFITLIEDLITDVSYFDENRMFYKAICEDINKALKSEGLIGEADPSVWSPARLLRLPMTENRKTPEAGFPKKNSVKRATMIQRNIEFCGFDLQQISGIPVPAPSEQIKLDELKRYPPPETDYVLQECEFLKFCKENPNEVSEENWYKMLSITSRLDNGREVSHEYSSGASSYSEYETDRKIEQSLTASGPRTCDNISKSFNCTVCPHFQKCTSPIVLHSENYIKTKHTGFRNIKITPKGDIVPGQVNHDDLRRYFIEEQDYISTPSGNIYTWNETHWEILEPVFLDSFVEEHVNPSPNSNDCREFRDKIRRTNLVEPDFLEASTDRRVNLKNGVLDFRSSEPVLMEHSKEFGFTYCMPYPYEPNAKCERFDKFLKEVTCNRQPLIDVILEYAGYAFTNADCKYQKALVLLGEGSNGKSTLMDTLTALAGSNSYSTIPLTKLEVETHVASLQGKLFNVTEETPKKSFAESSAFKNIVSGGAVSVRQLYGKPYIMRTNCKLILACNELPRTQDVTKGMTRRLLIVPFDASFEGKDKNINIKEELKEELSGILNRIIEGYKRLRDNKGFSDSTEIDNEVKRFIDDNDEVYEFVKEHLDIDYDFKTRDYVQAEYVSIKDIYHKYSDVYCDDAGIRPTTRNVLMRKLKRYLPELEVRKKRRDGVVVLMGINFRKQYKNDI